MSPPGNPDGLICLLFLSHSLKRSSIGFLVHKSAGGGVTLCPSVILRVVGLGASLDRSDSVPVTGRWILGHGQSPLGRVAGVAAEVATI